MKNFEIFMKNLKQLREVYGLNKTDFSRKTGIARSSINGYENGSNEPTLSVIIKIAEAFDISVQTLITKDLSAITVKKNDKDLVEEIDKSIAGLEEFSDPLLKKLFSKENLEKLKIMKKNYIDEIERLKYLAEDVLPQKVKVIEDIIKIIEDEIGDGVYQKD